MGNLFSAPEVVEMGIQIEKNGRDFYNMIEKSSKDPKAKEVFSFLGKEEEKHIKKFEAILLEVKKYEPSEAYPGEYFSYIKTLSEEHIFVKENKGAELAKDIKTDKEAIDKGIKFEKDSIVFYEAMKKVVLEGEHKTIDKLIEEEKSHLKKLSAMKSEIGE